MQAMNQLDDFDHVLAIPDTVPELYLPRGKRDPTRPFLKGDPFESERCVLPKPEALISLRSKQPLGLVDRRVLNVLLAGSWLQLMRGKLCAEVPTRDLRIAAGLGAQRDNRRLFESIRRLRTVPVEIWPPGVGTGLFGPLLAGCARVPGKKQLWIVWDSIVEPVLLNPIPFAPVDLAVARRIRSRHALILYEHLAQRAGLTWPVWSVDLGELRVLLGAAITYDSWRHLRRALEGALEQVRSVAGLDAQMEAAIPRGDHEPQKIIFRIDRATTSAAA